MLRGYIREVQELDAKVEEVNFRKKEIYDEARMHGFNVKALKAVARASSLTEVDNDTKVLRQYLTVLSARRRAAFSKTMKTWVRYCLAATTITGHRRTGDRDAI